MWSISSPICASDATFSQRIANSPRKFSQLPHVIEIQTKRRIFHEEKPISSPGNISAHGSEIFDGHGHACPVTVTRNIFNRHAAISSERCTDNAHGRFDAVFSRADSTKMGQCCHHSDRAVTAHSQVADIVEKDDSCGAAFVHRLAEQCADQYIRASRLIDHRRSEIVIFRGKTLQTQGERIVTQLRPAGDDHPRWLAGRMRIDNLNRRRWHARERHGKNSI